MASFGAFQPDAFQVGAFQMARLSAAVNAELAKTSPALHSILELFLPSGTRQYAAVGAPLESLELGYYEGKVTEWSDVVSRLSASVRPIETSAVVEDIESSHPLDSVLYGQYARKVRGSGARIRIAIPGVDESEWPIRFLGVIADVEGAGQFKWRFILRGDDLAMQAGTLPHGSVQHFQFPNPGDVKLYGTLIPLIYGLFDSRDGTLPGQGPVGSLPAYYVDNTTGAYRALCGFAHLFSVRRVFVDGTVLASSAWSRETLRMPGFQSAGLVAPYGGHRMTFMKLASDPGPNAKITWDGYGITSSGVGATTGSACAPIMNPVRQARHLLNNFALPDVPWSDGPYATVDHPLIDAGSWDAADAWMEARHYRGSLWIGGSEDVEPLTLVNDFVASHGAELYQTQRGKLALRPRDPHRMVIYTDTWLNSHEPEHNPMSPGRPVQGEGLVTELAAESFNVPAQGSGRTTLYVGDYKQERVMRRLTVRTNTRSRTGTRRRWGAGYSRFLRELLDSPKGVHFADDLQGDVYDGAPVLTWQDIKTFGTLYHLTQGTSAFAPTLNVKQPALVFDGTNDHYAGTALSNLISASGFHIAVVLKATADGGTNPDATADLNPTIFSAQQVGLHQLLEAGQNWLQFYVHDGTARVVRVPITKNRWYVVTCALLAGNIYCATRLFSPAIGTCGNVSSLANTFYVGVNNLNPPYWAGELAALIIQSNVDIGAQGTTAGFFGGGGFEYVHRSLADRFAISDWA